MEKIITVLKRFVYHWWKSLDYLKREIIVNQYQDEEGVNDNFIEGFTQESEDWLIVNYTDEIKDFIIESLAKDVKPLTD